MHKLNMDSMVEKNLYPHPLQHPLLILQDIQLQAEQTTPYSPPLSKPGHDFSGVHFAVDQYQLIIASQAISEVLHGKMQIKPSHVPGAKSWLYGLMSLRGQLLPIIDLKQYLMRITTTPAPTNRIIVINAPKQCYYGLLVEKIIGMKHFDFNEKIHQGPRFEGKIQFFLSGVFFSGNLYLGVLNTEKLSHDSDFKNAAYTQPER